MQRTAILRIFENRENLAFLFHCPDDCFGRWLTIAFNINMYLFLKLGSTGNILFRLILEPSTIVSTPRGLKDILTLGFRRATLDPCANRLLISTRMISNNVHQHLALNSAPPATRDNRITHTHLLSPNIIKNGRPSKYALNRGLL